MLDNLINKKWRLRGVATNINKKRQLQRVDATLREEVQKVITSSITF
jgi:hypothetical protein